MKSPAKVSFVASECGLVMKIRGDEKCRASQKDFFVCSINYWTRRNGISVWRAWLSRPLRTQRERVLDLKKRSFEHLRRAKTTKESRRIQGMLLLRSSNCDIIARQIDEIPIVTRLTSSVFADLLCQLDILFTHKSRGASSFVP